ncbi:MAG: hypothetical protein V4558_02245 [Gemmatimonadota bacterium]
MTGIPPQPPAPPTILDGAVRFSDQGLTLVDELTRKSPDSHRAIGMYAEGVRALQRDDGPESVHVAAYEFRELMSILPAILNVPRASHEQLNGQANALGEAWRHARTNSVCYRTGDWTGSIDPALLAFLVRCGAFFLWMEQNVPTRRAETAQMLTRLNPPGSPMPPSVMDVRTSKWAEMLRFFNGVTHHADSATRQRVEEELGRLEVFLLEHLVPTPIDDESDIDQLISDGEAPA